MEKPGTSWEQPSHKNEPKYKGVRKRKWGKWVCEIRMPNSRERIWLGSYDTAEKAARAFDAANYCLRGRGATFNFPGNPPPDISGGQSLSPQEIQEVAAGYANEEPTTKKSSDPQLSRAPMEEQHCTTSSSSDGAPQVDGNTTIDWSLYDLLDCNEGASDFGFYSEPECIGWGSGNYYHPPPTHIEYNRDDDEDAYSQPSFLWNF